MDRDEVYEEYRALAVPREQEREWMRTIRLEILQRMADVTEEPEFEHCLGESKTTFVGDADPDALLDLLGILQTRLRGWDTLGWDTMTLLRVGETVLSITSYLGTDGGNACTLGKQFARGVFEAVLGSPLSLSGYHLSVLRITGVSPGEVFTWAETALAKCEG